MFNPAAALHFRCCQTPIPLAPADRGEVKKGAFFGPDLLQLSIAGAQDLFAKSGSDSAGEFKLLVFVYADEQSTKMLSRPFGFGVSGCVMQLANRPS